MRVTQRQNGKTVQYILQLIKDIKAPVALFLTSFDRVADQHLRERSQIQIARTRSGKACDRGLRT